ncbi:PIG-L family deacetylase [Micromonospora sp. NPDC002717]|uniref:PIG-L deacetylase family protein n=1 Tax=Micromonospora sp. NPDC002717 TaxID=3154424 RepID=UPI003332DF5F
MAVHAHPDDEATSTGGVLARYAAEGITTVLVTCTDGRCGDGPGGVKPGDPGHDPEAVVAMRRAELAASCEALEVTHRRTPLMFAFLCLTRGVQWRTQKS